MNREHLRMEFVEALTLHQKGFIEMAKDGYLKILAEEPRHSDSLHLLGVIHYQSGNLDEARRLIAEAIEIDPHQHAAHSNLGNVLKNLRRTDEALLSYEKAISLRPDYADAHYNRGALLFDLNRVEEAVACYDEAIRLRPGFAAAYVLRGNAIAAMGFSNEAMLDFERAISFNPGLAVAFVSRGATLESLGRTEEALSSYNRSLEIDPASAIAHWRRGNALRSLKRPEEAMLSYQRALELSPQLAEANLNLGNVLRELGRRGEAATRYAEAVASKPDYADAHYNLGTVLYDLGRIGEAVASFDRAISLRPDFAEAYNNRSTALFDLGRREHAIEGYLRAISLKEDFTSAHVNLGRALIDGRRFEEAIRAFERALKLEPDWEFLRSTLRHTRLRICDWTHYAEDIGSLKVTLDQGNASEFPFAVLAATDDPNLQFRAAQAYRQLKYPRRTKRPFPSPRIAGSRIRIGYYSSDFRNHPVSHLAAELFEVHDRGRFEISAFSFGPKQDDAMRQRIAEAADSFFDVSDATDAEVVELSRRQGIDIAVDLNGFTQHERSAIFSEGCAPVQVNFLGFPGTMGSEFIDYIIADRNVIPEELFQYYSEKVVQLPLCFQANDSRRKMSDQRPSRSECGLPEKGFVFCCFNNTYKINPAVFDCWMRLLSNVKDSVLWLYEENASAGRNLAEEAEARGIDPKRLVFAKRVDVELYLARYTLADLFLDTFPFNGGTTASDALWAGLPVLTLRGNSFASRMASSLLTALEIPELITGSLADYEAAALDIAGNSLLASSLKERLIGCPSRQKLFSGRAFAEGIEHAYLSMFETQVRGRMPDHIRFK